MTAAPAAARRDTPQATPAIAITDLDAYFGSAHAVRSVTLDVQPHEVTAIIGPAGCGKSTLLRCVNRMHETVPGARVTGSVRLAGLDVYGPGTNAIAVRRHIGMVFQRPTPFPTMSIRDNVAAGLRVAEGKRPTGAALDAIEDRLHRSAAAVPGGALAACLLPAHSRRSVPPTTEPIPHDCGRAFCGCSSDW